MKKTRMIKKVDIKKFERLAEKLNSLMIKICEYNPEAEIFVDGCWNMNLMKGPTHGDDWHEQNPIMGNVVSCVTVFKTCGGGW